jgi:hypothetical protein
MMFHAVLYSLPYTSVRLKVMCCSMLCCTPCDLISEAQANVMLHAVLYSSH